MPAFSALSRKGPIALFALSLSAFVPVAGLAQETSTVLEQAAPASAIPADWVAYERYGLRFSAPATMEFIEDIGGNNVGSIWLTQSDPETNSGTRLGMRIVPVEEHAAMPTPGSEDYTAALSNLVSLPLIRTEQTVMLGDLELRVYSTGSIADDDDTTDSVTRMMWLVAETPLLSNEGLWVGSFSAGLAEGEVIAIEQAFVASLGAENTAMIGVDLPEAPAPTVAVPDDAPDIAPVVEPEVMADADTMADPEPPVAEAAPMDDPEPPVAEADPMADPEPPVAEAMPVDDPAPIAEAPAPTPAPMFNVVADRLGLTLADDIAVSGVTEDAQQVWATLTHPNFPDLVHTAVFVSHPGADLEALTTTLMDRFNAIVSVVEGQHQGAPVWIISGPASRQPNGDYPRADRPHAHMMVTQNCLPGAGPAVFGVVTSEMRSAPVVLDVILSTLTLTMPPEAALCSPEVGDAVMALPLGTIDRPEPPAEIAPVTMVETDRFGFRIMAPDTMRIRRDRDHADRREIWLTDTDEDTRVGSDVVLRVFSPRARAEITGSDAIDGPEFAETLSRLGDSTISQTDETLQIGSTTLSYFRGTGMDDDGSGIPRERRLLYLINPHPTATGLSPWVAITSFGLSEDEAAAHEQRSIEGLQLLDPTIYDGTRVDAFFNGAVRIAVLPGQAVANSEEHPEYGFFSLSDAEISDSPHTLFAMEARSDAGPDVVAAVTQRLLSIDAITEGNIDGVPVWLFDGRVDRQPNQRQTPAGLTSPARLIVTRSCVPGAGPLVIGLLATQDRLDQADGFDALMAPMRLSMPAGSTACPAELDQALAEIRLTAAPQPDVQIPPDATPDVVMPDVIMPPPPSNTGKPGDTPAVDPEIAAWDTAREADSVQSMMAYLLEYPRGAHSLEARDRLNVLSAPPPVADADTQAWEAARRDGSRNAMWTYLRAFPQGAYVTQAHEVLRNLAPPRMPEPVPTPQPAPLKRG